MALIAFFASNEPTKKMLMANGYSLELFNELVAV